MRGHFPNDVTRLRIRAAIRTLEHTLWFPGPAHTAGSGPSMEIPLVIGVNPLQTTLFELGIVSGRVVLLLRSAEIQPVFVRFVIEYLRIFSLLSNLHFHIPFLHLHSFSHSLETDTLQGGQWQ